jgi:hypothetical protein
MNASFITTFLVRSLETFPNTFSIVLNLTLHEAHSLRLIVSCSLFRVSITLVALLQRTHFIGQ